MRTGEYDWRDKKVFVTGASGFKGAWLCAALLALGARVFGTVTGNRNGRASYHLLGLDDRITQVPLDVTDRQAVYDRLNAAEPDVIFHLAAKAVVPVALRDPRRAFEVNVMGTLNVVEACRKLGRGDRLVVCSTDHVFGNTAPADLPPGGFDERARVSYGGPYDTSKAAMELIVRCDHHTYWTELPAIGVTRCSNVFGIGDTNARRVVPLFVHAAVREGVVPLRYRLSGRQFIHVTDAIAGYVRGAALGLGEGGARAKAGRARPDDRSPFTPTFHFALEDYGTPEPFVRMGDLAGRVAAAFGAAVDDAACVDYPPNENRVQALTCAATRAALGWAPAKPLDRGLAELGAWYRAEGDPAAQDRMVRRDLDELLAAATR